METKPQAQPAREVAFTEHIARVDVYKAAPKFRAAMIAMTEAASEGLPAQLVELMEVRASQINHCSWCLRMHAADALAAGVPQHKLTLLPTWAEAGDLFSAPEQAALALVEAITELTNGFVPDEAYQRAAAVFNEDEVAHLIAVAASINAFNRVSVAARRTPRFHR